MWEIKCKKWYSLWFFYYYTSRRATVSSQWDLQEVSAILSVYKWIMC